MTILTAKDVCFSIGTRDILKNISFSVETGDRLAVVGVNGAGKSTLLKIISGEYEADSGGVFTPSRISVGLMKQNMDFNIIEPSYEGSPVDSTVLGQMYAAFPKLIEWEREMDELEKLIEATNSRSSAPDLAAAKAGERLAEISSMYAEEGGLQYKARAKSFLMRLGFTEDYHSVPVSSLSGGERTRLTLARLLASEPDILMLDEPTNHLDEDTLVWLEGHLASYKKTLILVSHDRYFLDRTTNKTLDIEYGECRLYRGSYTEFTEKKKALRAEEEKRYELQQKEIARLEAFIENQRKWNRERNIIAAESRQKTIDRMEKVQRPKDEPRSITFSFTPASDSGSDVLTAKHLKMGFDGRILFDDLSFDVKKGDRLFILGPNGCGKSTLVKLLMEKLFPISGSLIYGYNVEIGYYDQENQNLSPDKTVLEELWDAYPASTQTELRSILAAFMFRGDDIEKKVAVLSGGERARLTLSKLILSRMNLLILDEPTNHLDISSREALEDALRGFGGTLISVSHDRYFISKLATRILAFGEGGTVTDFKGTYDEYNLYVSRAKENPASAQNAPAPQTQSSGKEAYLERKKEAAELRRQEKHKREIAEEIKKLEARLVEITDALTITGSDYQLAFELEDERITVEDRLMQLYEEEETL